MKVPPRKRDQLSLNNDHTHFIIIREQPIGLTSSSNSTKRSLPNENNERCPEKLTDSSESATNRFRDRFEDFLHQENLQLPVLPSNSNELPVTTGN